MISKRLNERIKSMLGKIKTEIRQINKEQVKRFSQGNIMNVMKDFHPSQSKTMHEALIVVDQNDNQIDTLSKIDAHLKSKKNPYPHRAFSVFLFNKDNKMLLQKRSNIKVTFPNLWSNTCCSHPLDLPEERVTTDNLGIKRGAVRRMKFEFGVDTKEDDYHPVEKILYRADSDHQFEEFELDYILVSKIDFEESHLRQVMNQDEVSNFKYVAKDELMQQVRNEDLKITPWFRLIIENRLNKIWNYAESIDLNVGEERRNKQKGGNEEKIQIINYL